VNPPELIIFDCDGVLVDSEPIAMRVLLETIATAGLDLPESAGYARLLGRSLRDIRDILAAEFGIELDDPALAAMRQRLYAAFRAELRPIPGIVEVLDRLPVPYCVASSSQPERIEVSLRATGLWPRFEGRVFSATMVARGKPAPDLFLHAARTMGFAAHACVVVEDSPAGIEAAQAGGMRVVGFLGGTHARRPEHRAAVAVHAPDSMIDSMRSLPGVLAALS
jgi:HAD superfamily hydrolase (TIGR01509 family)